jgi:hypothetical protein
MKILIETKWIKMKYDTFFSTTTYITNFDQIKMKKRQISNIIQ